jgi:hypothetical protein
MKKCCGCKKDKPETEFWKRDRVNKYLSSYCKDCKREQKKKAYLDNPEKYKNQSKKWYQDNLNKARNMRIKSKEKVKLEVLSHYSKDSILKCNCCPETEIKFLTIDHINNDGFKERKILNKNGGAGFYFWLRKNNYPNGYRTLCFNCNMAKSLYGKCPHNK